MEPKKHIVNICKDVSNLVTKHNLTQRLYEQCLFWTIPDREKTHKGKGGFQNDHIYDGTLYDAVEEQAGHLVALTVNPSTVWHAYETGDIKLDEDKEVYEFLQAYQKTVLNFLNNSNFLQVYEAGIIDQNILGTCASSVAYSKEEKKLIFKNHDVQYLKYRRTQDGKLLVISKTLSLSYAEIVNTYSEKDLPKKFIEDNKEQPDSEHEVEVYIREKTKEDEGNINGTFPWVSYHILTSHKHQLKVEGFKRQPILLADYLPLSEEDFSRSPTYRKLADAKTLNSFVKSDIIGTQLTMAPPIQVEDNSVVRKLSFRPHGITIVRKGSEIKPIVTGARVDIADAKIVRLQESIRNYGFHLDKFRLVEQDRMTATEIIERKDERFRGVASRVFRIERGLLTPLMEAVSIELENNKLLPPLPEILKGKDINIRYTSTISKAQEAGEAQNLQRLMATIGPLAEMNPQIMDFIDGDAIVKGEAKRFNVVSSYIKSQEEVDKGRKVQAENQQQVQGAELNNQNAQTEKIQAETDAIDAGA